MPDQTPIMGWTIPSISDPLVQIVAATIQGLRDIEQDLYLAADSKSSSADHATYPPGISLMPLTTSNSDSGWPAVGTSLVATLRRSNAANGAIQIWFRLIGTTIPEMHIRSGGASGWSPWGRAVGSGTARAVAGGTITFNNNFEVESQTVAFPTGRFTAAPAVSATAHGSGYVASVSGISATGLTITITPQEGGTAMGEHADRIVDWTAIQVY